jgi:hypothetical protein
LIRHNLNDWVSDVTIYCAGIVRLDWPRQIRQTALCKAEIDFNLIKSISIGLCQTSKVNFENKQSSVLSFYEHKPLDANNLQ